VAPVQEVQAEGAWGIFRDPATRFRVAEAFALLLQAAAERNRKRAPQEAQTPEFESPLAQTDGSPCRATTCCVSREKAPSGTAAPGALATSPSARADRLTRQVIFVIAVAVR
jgi:hypothetical protein